MPAKDPEKRRATFRAWYARTKHRRSPDAVARSTSVKRARRHATIAWFENLKGELACERCGEHHPAVLQFHHADPSAKEIMISAAVSRGWSRERILDEAKKCEVLCANCHAKHHAAENARG